MPAHLEIRDNEKSYPGVRTPDHAGSAPAGVPCLAGRNSAGALRNGAGATVVEFAHHGNIILNGTITPAK